MTDNTVWWEGLDKNPPVDATEWKGAKVNGPGVDDRPARTRSWLIRTPDSPLRLRTAPAYLRNSTIRHGVPISAIIFGGRRASTTPLVYQSFDWVHGTYHGFRHGSSETTAAATGAVGVLRHDPMAMKPFMRLQRGRLLGSTGLKWARSWATRLLRSSTLTGSSTDDEGNFIWPGFGDNMRVLDWIIKRVEGKVDAVETPIGFLPKKGDINLKGIEDEVTSEVEDKLLAVDVDLWKKEIAEMRRYYNDDIKAKGGNIPQALYDELDKIEARLNKA